MRFVPTNCLREGLELGKTLYGVHNEPLLKSGIILTKSYIEGIRRLKFPGVYIQDDLSKDIETIDVISDNLRIATTSSIKKMFVKAENGSKVSEDDISQQVESIIEELLDNKNMMINMIDLKCFDNYTYAHSVNVAVLSIVMGIAAGWKKDSLVQLGLGAILHDIGKVFVTKDVLNKPGRLSDDEFDEISRHSEFGHEYVLKHFSLPYKSYMAILDHHEKYDGTGYPGAKRGRAISRFGRVIAIADVYDALTSERPYRGAMNPADAIEYIMAGNGTMFDPVFVELFVRKIAPYPVGTMVCLSNSWTGIVVENYAEACLRPLVRIIEKNEDQVDPFDISLFDQREYLNVTISGVVAS